VIGLDFFKKDLAGICFSSKGIVLIQQCGGKIKNQLSCVYPSAEGEAATAITDDIFDVFKNKEMEMMAFLQKAIRDSKIDTSRIVVALPPKDLIVRFFEMPNIPRSEVLAGINFEMKKYIPFKIEELAYDFQYRIKRKANIIEVVLCGIKQDPLDRYVELFKKLKLQPVAFEPGLFSLFRLLIIKGRIVPQRSYVILEFDRKEANILIIERGFPYFTRDIKLMTSAGTVNSQDEFDAVLFRLINEVRVSLDYYKRQFLKKDVDEMLIISNKTYSNWVDNFSKELGLKVSFASLGDIFKVKDVRDDMLSEAGKAFGAALRVVRPSLITLNLWRAKEKAEKAAGFSLLGVSSEDLQELVLTFFRDSKTPLIKGGVIGALILMLGYGLGFSKVFPLEKELSVASVKQPPFLPGIDLTNLESIQTSETTFSEKVRDYRGLVEEYVPFYKNLLLLPRLFPQGVWMGGVSFNYYPLSLRLNCFSYAQDQKASTENINKLIDNLRGNKQFSEYFSSIDLKSYREVSKDDILYLEFDVFCEKKR
jgi:hypothetical protein